LLEAEDAVQSVMVRQVASGRWEHIEHPHGFFCRAVIRAVFMIHRSRSNHREQALTDESDNVSGAGDGLTVWEDTEWVLSLLNALPTQQRKVMALTLDGLSGMEIAQRIGASEATVRSNLRHARDRLAKLLTEPNTDETVERRREGEL
jgi:RNA polymerase sigma-70 factor (ECF subfamily)